MRCASAFGVGSIYIDVIISLLYVKEERYENKCTWTIAAWNILLSI
jgi:hypothetical protein